MTESTRTKSMSPPQQNSAVETNFKDKYEEIKKIMDSNNKKHTEALNQINESLAQVVKTRKDIRQALRDIDKEILEKELKAMLPEIVKTVLEEISAVKITVTKNCKGHTQHIISVKQQGGVSP
eukprot:3072403-Ditylum_brightwellii.AAC.1